MSDGFNRKFFFISKWIVKRNQIILKYSDLLRGRDKV